MDPGGSAGPRGPASERAVVETLTVNGAGSVPLTIAEAGVTEQFVPRGFVPWNAQASATVPLNPVGAICRLKVAVPPAVTVADVDPPEPVPSTKSVPVPASVTVWGLPEALSAIARVPAPVPPDVGLKVTLIVQLTLAASELPQSLVWEKSPVSVIPLIESAALPESLRVTGCPELAVPSN